MKKALFVATVVKTHIMEFHIPYLKMLKEMGWETAVASRNDYDDPADCVIPYCDTYYDVPFERNPFKPGNLKAYKQLKKIIDEGHYDIIHCHTPVGAMLTRLAASDARKQGSKVIYTAHGFHFYKGAPLINWLAYYPVEKALAKKTDVLITINKEDYERAKNKFKAGRVEYVPGVGIDVKKFGAYSAEHAKAIRAELGIAADQKVLLSVGEVNVNKNHRIVIDALTEFPEVCYIVCGRGPLINDHESHAKSIGVGERVRFVGYRTDVKDFYGMADVFVFPSLREGLPVALMEAMAAGLPCVASRNRGSDDLLQESPLRFNANDKDELIQKLEMALNQDQKAEIYKNRNTVLKYDINSTKKVMSKIYEEVQEAK
jgi:glycosyltransferase EpsD